VNLASKQAFTRHQKPVDRPTCAGSAPAGRLTASCVVEGGGRERSAKQKRSQISGAHYRCGEATIAPPQISRGRQVAVSKYRIL